LVTLRNPTSTLEKFHDGEAAAIALATEEGWWLLINEERPLMFARQRGIKAVTVPEFIVYLYQAQILSYRSTLAKLDGIASNTGHRVMQVARQEFLALAQSRGDVERGEAK